mmetsp:Transcript_33933/g.73541  ORF Transcript_33933/g.73541 Transcript_33933/m.73541 type:complete len:308 (-) Transcript_33933:107-1030(-)
MRSLLLGLTAGSAAGSAMAFTHVTAPPSSVAVTSGSCRQRSPTSGSNKNGITAGGPLQRIRMSSRESHATLHATSKSSSGGVKRPENEFSRRYRTEAVLPSGGRTGRDYRVSVSASEEERGALANRFRLSEIARLDADVVLRRDKSGSAYDSDCIQIDGTVLAAVTQKCVRTNEDFDVNLEFDVSAAVRPVQSTETNDDADMAEIERALGNSGSGGGGNRSRRGNKRGGKRDKSIRADRSIDDVGMKALQDMLQDFDIDEDIVEDEAVLGSDGFIDVGELVAQLFRLKLDPYPKKPGSEPINLSFSG